MQMCQNFPFIEITLATTACGEGDFLVYERFDTPSSYCILFQLLHRQLRFFSVAR